MTGPRCAKPATIGSRVVNPACARSHIYYSTPVATTKLTLFSVLAMPTQTFQSKMPRKPSRQFSSRFRTSGITDSSALAQEAGLNECRMHQKSCQTRLAYPKRRTFVKTETSITKHSNERHLKLPPCSGSLPAVFLTETR